MNESDWIAAKDLLTKYDSREIPLEKSEGPFKITSAASNEYMTRRYVGSEYMTRRQGIQNPPLSNRQAVLSAMPAVYRQQFDEYEGLQSPGSAAAVYPPPPVRAVSSPQPQLQQQYRSAQSYRNAYHRAARDYVDQNDLQESLRAASQQNLTALSRTQGGYRGSESSLSDLQYQTGVYRGAHRPPSACHSPNGSAFDLELSLQESPRSEHFSPFRQDPSHSPQPKSRASGPRAHHGPPRELLSSASGTQHPYVHSLRSANDYRRSFEHLALGSNPGSGRGEASKRPRGRQHLEQPRIHSLKGALAEQVQEPTARRRVASSSPLRSAPRAPEMRELRYTIKDPTEMTDALGLGGARAAPKIVGSSALFSGRKTNTAASDAMRRRQPSIADPPETEVAPMSLIVSTATDKERRDRGLTYTSRSMKEQESTAMPEFKTRVRSNSLGSLRRSKGKGLLQGSANCNGFAVSQVRPIQGRRNPSPAPVMRSSHNRAPVEEMVQQPLSHSGMVQEVEKAHRARPRTVENRLQDRGKSPQHRIRIPSDGNRTTSVDKGIRAVKQRANVGPARLFVKPSRPPPPPPLKSHVCVKSGEERSQLPPSPPRSRSASAATLSLSKKDAPEMPRNIGMKIHQMVSQNTVRHPPKPAHRPRRKTANGVLQCAHRPPATQGPLDERTLRCMNMVQEAARRFQNRSRLRDDTRKELPVRMRCSSPNPPQACFDQSDNLCPIFTPDRVMSDSEDLGDDSHRELGYFLVPGCERFFKRSRSTSNRTIPTPPKACAFAKDSCTTTSSLCDSQDDQLGSTAKLEPNEEALLDSRFPSGDHSDGNRSWADLKHLLKEIERKHAKKRPRSFGKCNWENAPAHRLRRGLPRNPHPNMGRDSTKDQFDSYDLKDCDGQLALNDANSGAATAIHHSHLAPDSRHPLPHNIERAHTPLKKRGGTSQCNGNDNLHQKPAVVRIRSLANQKSQCPVEGPTEKKIQSLAQSLEPQSLPAPTESQVEFSHICIPEKSHKAQSKHSQGPSVVSSVPFRVCLSVAELSSRLPCRMGKVSGRSSTGHGERADEGVPTLDGPSTAMMSVAEDLKSHTRQHHSISAVLSYENTIVAELALQSEGMPDKGPNLLENNQGRDSRSEETLESVVSLPEKLHCHTREHHLVPAVPSHMCLSVGELVPEPLVCTGTSMGGNDSDDVENALETDINNDDPCMDSFSVPEKLKAHTRQRVPSNDALSTIELAVQVKDIPGKILVGKTMDHVEVAKGIDSNRDDETSTTVVSVPENLKKHARQHHIIAAVPAYECLNIAELAPPQSKDIQLKVLGGKTTDHIEDAKRIDCSKDIISVPEHLKKHTRQHHLISAVPSHICLSTVELTPHSLDVTGEMLDAVEDTQETISNNEGLRMNMISVPEQLKNHTRQHHLVSTVPYDQCLHVAELAKLPEEFSAGGINLQDDEAVATMVSVPENPKSHDRQHHLISAVPSHLCLSIGKLTSHSVHATYKSLDENEMDHVEDAQMAGPLNDDEGVELISVPEQLKSHARQSHLISTVPSVECQIVTEPALQSEEISSRGINPQDDEPGATVVSVPESVKIHTRQHHLISAVPSHMCLSVGELTPLPENVTGKLLDENAMDHVEDAQMLSPNNEELSTEMISVPEHLKSHTRQEHLVSTTMSSHMCIQQALNVTGKMHGGNHMDHIEDAQMTSPNLDELSTDMFSVPEQLKSHTRKHHSVPAVVSYEYPSVAELSQQPENKSDQGLDVMAMDHIEDAKGIDYRDDETSTTVVSVPEQLKSHTRQRHSISAVPFPVELTLQPENEKTKLLDENDMDHIEDAQMISPNNDILSMDAILVPEHLQTQSRQHHLVPAVKSHECFSLVELATESEEVSAHSLDGIAVDATSVCEKLRSHTQQQVTISIPHHESLSVPELEATKSPQTIDGDSSSIANSEDTFPVHTRGINNYPGAKQTLSYARKDRTRTSTMSSDGIFSGATSEVSTPSNVSFDEDSQSFDFDNSQSSFY